MQTEKRSAGGAASSAPIDRAAQISRPVAAAFGAAVFVAYFAFLGAFPLAEPDEARYAEIPREMLERGDWVTPTLNYVKYFEKPPLLYWLTATGYRVMGIHEWAVRFWPAAFAFAGIAITWHLGGSMWNIRAGGLAALVLATSPLYFGLSQVVVLDMPLSILMTFSLGGFWLFYRQPEPGRSGLLALHLGSALAVLAKGPVAVVLIGAILFVFLLLRGNLAPLRGILRPSGIAVFAAAALPWFVLVSRRNPEFLDFFIVDQHFRRYLAPTEHRQPLWFFVPIVFVGLLPWSAMIVRRGQVLRDFVSALLRRRCSDAALYCTVWAGVVFAFFSLSGSKLATYVLPMAPPLALLAGRWFDRLLTGDPQPLFAATARAFVVTGTILVVGTAVAAEVSDLPVVGIVLWSVRLAAGGLFASGMIARHFVCRSAPGTALAALFAGMLAVQVAALGGRGAAASYERLGTALRAAARPDDRVVAYRHYVQGIPFYARRRTIMARGAGELSFGSRQGDQSEFFWPRDEQLASAWASGRPLFLVVNRSELETLRPLLLPSPREITAQGKKVVVVNFPPRKGDNS